jgi:hypothetical protein
MEEWQQSYAKLSLAAYEQLRCDRAMAYGDRARECLDFFFAASPSSLVFVFIHGGFWRMGAKENTAHLASSFVSKGYHFVTVEYPLVPEVPFATIMESMNRLASALPGAVPLTPGGILVNQNGVPFLQRDEAPMTLHRRRRAGFRDVGFYLAAVPSYYGGLMALGWASDDRRKRDVPPATLARRFAAAKLRTKYYTPELHRAAFALPAFIGNQLR